MVTVSSLTLSSSFSLPFLIIGVGREMGFVPILGIRLVIDGVLCLAADGGAYDGAESSPSLSCCCWTAACLSCLTGLGMRVGNAGCIRDICDVLGFAGEPGCAPVLELGAPEASDTTPRAGVAKGTRIGLRELPVMDMYAGDGGTCFPPATCRVCGVAGTRRPCWIVSGAGLYPDSVTGTRRAGVRGISPVRVPSPAPTMPVLRRAGLGTRAGVSTAFGC